jgi:c-di-GMP-binding flagellar brake protein YcgR
MSETPERRIAKRIEIRLPIVYRGADGTPVHGTTLNVSRRGMLLVVKQSAAPRSRVSVAVTGADGREREVTGEVVRATPEGKIAVAFPESAAATLDEVIDAKNDAPPAP